ncbi:SCA7 domain-containing protein [Phanerochaete sordida]|uniref:SCA7 domain-containing protein n=1 Tax=Phanerochaete sordida TaxID=48140 RepID=A0A9P3LCY4_9APHY|nr:SCA7 domain-containing protein [Phanerochaete sordida]
MTLKLRASSSPEPASPFDWDKVPDSPQPPPDSDPATPSSPPTQWLSARDMKVFGASPLKSTVGIVKCKDCEKPVLRSAMAEHAEACLKARNAAKKGGKGKVEPTVNGKKRKVDDDEPPHPDEPPKQKKKPLPKVTKGRAKGPVDLDRQCGVINDKGLQCSRSLTCKSHSMGAKRAVLGRSRKYDDLLLDWNREHNPNFVEPVKRESKQERKERKEKEKVEKKRLAMEAAAAAGVDVSKKTGGTGGTSNKKSKKAAAATTMTSSAAAITASTKPDDPADLEDVDSETEMDALVNSVRHAAEKGMLGQPLAAPYDASSWFVVRRERVRTCRDLLALALMPSARAAAPGVPVATRL